MTSARLRRIASWTGLAALVLAVPLAALQPAQLARSYLLGWLYWAAIGFGSLGIFLLHRLTGGRWGEALRPQLLAGVATLPALAVAFLPVLLAAASIFPWIGHVPAHLTAWLSMPAFVARAVVYLGTWTLLAVLVARWSRDGRDGRLRALAGPGLVACGLTVSFAAHDWVLSLEPHFHSSITGMLHLAGGALAGTCFALLGALALTPDAVPPDRRSDLATLLLALVLLWTYVTFAQFLIAWSGNLPHEAEWYVPRTRGGWGVVALVLGLLHFLVPFLLLLHRPIKRSARWLLGLCAGLLVLRGVDLAWLVLPAFHAEGRGVHALDVLVPLALGGGFAWWWCRALDRNLLAGRAA